MKNVTESAREKNKFYLSDYEQIKEIATINGKVDLFTAINTSLCFGFMLGYKARKKEGKA